MPHILRGIPPRFDGRPISPESLIRLLRRWNHTGALFGTWTRRKPGRTAELEGGSVYFVARGWTLFRAPLVRIEPVRNFTGHRPVDLPFDDAWSLTCNPDITLVECTRIPRLLGGRYLTPEAAPQGPRPGRRQQAPRQPRRLTQRRPQTRAILGRIPRKEKEPSESSDPPARPGLHRSRGPTRYGQNS